MALKKRDVNKEKIVEKEKQKNEVKVEKKPIKKNESSNSLKSLLITLLTMIILSSGMIVYLKYKQPEIYEDRILKYIKTNPIQTTTAASSASSSIPSGTSSITSTPTVSTPTGKIDFKNIPIKELLEKYEDKLEEDEIFYLKNLIQQQKIERITEKNPKFKNVKKYYDEPIGQMIKRISLENPVVLFINTADEKSKVTRLAVSKSQIPFGVMEVDTEPRAGEIAEALFRMTAQRSFPYIFINGKFFGTSVELKEAMQTHRYFPLIEEGKEQWLRDKEKFRKVIEKREMQKEEKERKKIEKIIKKIEQIEKSN